MTFWTYMLRCADGRYYVGHTDALDRRIAQHHHGKGCDFTARRQPVALVWSEGFVTRLEALEAEQRLKGWSRAKKEALIAGNWARLHELAVSHEARPSTSLRTNGDGRNGAPLSARPQPALSVRPDAPLSVRPEPVEGLALGPALSIVGPAIP
ncbi:GIY-YIG nuclease family protein [Sphingomonas sp. BIUV-7]|uniref:GIY-YIG nuclease family protein n=1 Tax=Sphingomonas natans TaxID=3063330 RepID=A0ABT8Y5E7_9SPHN|nr:GIY-YIG nuclease family protein [Sphingomonas sp. BIUV-7]MDO6412890.1 GIY-YIG nuclease family protein [Sphingomonas sp. BIUV-7]